MTTSKKQPLIHSDVIMEINLQDPYGETQPVVIANGESETETDDSDVSIRIEPVKNYKENNSETVSNVKHDGKGSMKSNDNTATISMADSSVPKSGSKD
jgi:hypothetical protein